MKFSDLSEYIYATFVQLREVDGNGVEFHFQLMERSDEVESIQVLDVELEDVYPVVPIGGVPVVTISCPEYIGYSILNETYGYNDSSEIYTGRVFRIYSESNYLNYIRSHTMAGDGFPGPLRHYQMIAVDQVVDLITASDIAVEWQPSFIE